MIAGFEAPTSGEILLDGRSVTRLPPHKRDLGMVFQNYALFPHMTVRDNIAYPLRRRGMNKADIAEQVSAALRLVELSGLDERRPVELSGGQQQRVALARATVYNPPALLMDEPLSALDKKLRQAMQEEIRRIHRNLATTVVYVTHDQEEALALSDRIALMRDGRIEQVGTPQEVYESPRSVFAATFLGEANLLAGELLERDRHGVASIRLDTGAVVRAADSESVQPGDRVRVVVRPERMTVSVDEGESATGGTANGVSVALDELVYLGHAVRCVGRFDTGERWVTELDESTAAAVARSGRCQVSWEAAHATVVRELDRSRPAGGEA
jgi:putative spermidine/putrescine transport system ATP-binding protein